MRLWPKKARKREKKRGRVEREGGEGKKEREREKKKGKTPFRRKLLALDAHARATRPMLNTAPSSSLASCYFIISWSISIFDTTLQTFFVRFSPLGYFKGNKQLFSLHMNIACICCYSFSYFSRPRLSSNFFCSWLPHLPLVSNQHV